MKNTTSFKRLGLKKLMVLVLWTICISLSGNTVLAEKTKNRVDLRVELDKGVLPSDTSQNAVVKITLDAPQPPTELERPPVNLAIVLDRSGSMNGEKLEKAKQAAIEVVRRLGHQDIFSLIIYDHNVETIVPAQSARNVEWIESRIRRIQSGGNTALFGGVSQGASEVRKNLKNDYVHRVILLSDGLANVGPSTPHDLGRLGTALMKEEISVTTMGVGTDYNEDLMARLAQNSDGNTYFVESSRDLPRIFATELGDVLNVVAKKVHVNIECPNGVTPLRIIGREGRIKGNTIEFSLNQLYGGQEKYALVEVMIPAIRSGGDLEVAMAKASYMDPFTLKQEVSKAKVTASFSKDREKVEKSANVGVQKELYLNLKALAEEKAITYSDEGNRVQAGTTLQKSAKQLKEFGEKYNDQEILQQAEELEKDAEMILEEGIDKVFRKEIRTRSFQIQNQQEEPSQTQNQQEE